MWWDNTPCKNGAHWKLYHSTYCSPDDRLSDFCELILISVSSVYISHTPMKGARQRTFIDSNANFISELLSGNYVSSKRKLNSPGKKLLVRYADIVPLKWHLQTVVARTRRFLSMSPSPFPSGTPPSRLHPHDISAQLPGRSSVVAVLLDRSRIGAGPDFAQHPHHTDNHHSEFGSSPLDARRFVYEGHWRLDGDMSRVCVWRLHRILGCQHSGPPSEGSLVQVCHVGRHTTSGRSHGPAVGRNLQPAGTYNGPYKFSSCPGRGL